VTLRGSVASFPLETIVQLIAATAKTGQLEVRGGGESGTLGFADGRLVSALSGDDQGDAALGALLGSVVAGQRGVPGVGDRQDLGAGYQCRDLAGVLQRGAQVGGAVDHERRDGRKRSGGHGRRRGRRPAEAEVDDVRAQRARAEEGVERSVAECLDDGVGLLRARLAARGAVPGEHALFAERRREHRVAEVLPGRLQLDDALRARREADQRRRVSAPRGRQRRR